MKILITAGPTQEAIDPVRFISNRSSGKMGYAIARAAVGRGHQTRLISGPVALAAPASARLIPVVSAREMLRAVEDNLGWCDALVMAAAVSDWQPARVRVRKMKKAKGAPVLLLKQAPDILKRVSLRKGPRIVIGFAAETHNLAREAARKLREKRLDLIVANDVSRPDSGFEVDTNRVTLIDAGGRTQKLPLLSKREVGARLIKWLEREFGRRSERA